MTFQLRPDQIEDLAFFIKNPKAGMWDEPGTGKTPKVCVLQAYRWREHGHGTLWTMPKALLHKNFEEAMRWGGWTKGDVVIVDGTRKQVDAQLQSGAKVFLMGFTRFAKSWRQLPDYVVAHDVDEFHKGFGAHESKRTQEMYEFDRRRGHYFVPMTGTLVKGKLDTAYPAIQVIEPRYYGTFEAFKQVHHVLDPWSGKLVGYCEHEALGDVLRTHGTRRLWRDIHGEKEYVVHIERLDMSPKQREIYDKFHEEAILELESFFIDGTQPGVAFTRARQIMEHPNLFPDLRDPEKLPPVDIMPGEAPAKLEALDLHITDAIENGKPLPIFAGLIPQQRQIYELMKVLDLPCDWMAGFKTAKERGEIDVKFQAGALRGLVCSPLIADCGFNWQFCGDDEVDHCLFASMDFLDTTFLQARDRFMRKARSGPLRITILVYRNSLDEHILRLLKSKSRDANKVDPTREVVPW